MISYVRGEVLYCTDSAVVVDVGSVGMEVNVTSQTLSAMEMATGPVEFYTYLHVKEDALTLYGFNSRNELKLFKMLITVSGIGPKSALGILSQISASDLIAAIISEDSATIAKTPGVGAKSAGKIVLELKDKLTFEDMLRIGNTGGILHGNADIDGTAADVSKEASANGSAEAGGSSDAGYGTAEGSDPSRASVKSTGSGRKASANARNSGKKEKNTGNSAETGAGKDALQLQENKNEAIQALSVLGYSVSDAMKAVRSVELEAGMTTEDILKQSLKYL